MKTIHRSLVVGCSLVALSACGADEIAAPGTGGNITINYPSTPAPTPAPTPTPTATLVTPAAGCPTLPDPEASGQLVDDGTIVGPEGTWRVCTLPKTFNVSSTLPRVDGLLYRLNGRVDVGTDGGPTASSADTDVTLTIEPGVILYASGSSFLMVNRGNKIKAEGTADMPIIFTSRDNVLGLNNDSSAGQWGGVVLGGRAPVTDCRLPGSTPGTVDCDRQVEGASAPALFGGATDDDSSGSLKFVQIRYSGFVLSGDNELQSLTTGGTGTGTQFDSIMSYNSSDDGVEFFGGHVNAKHMVVVGAEDDGLDTDTGVKANMQYVIVAQRAGAGDTIIEADSNNGLEDQTPRQHTQISNATFLFANPGDQAIRIRGGTDYSIVNSVLVDNSGGTACLRVDLPETTRAADAALDDVGPPVFEAFVLDCATDFRDGSGGVTAAQTQGFFDAGSNNDSGFTNSLTMTYVNGASEDALTSFDPTGLSSFFEDAGFVGAVQASNDWTQGWTCDSSTIAFGNNTGACTALPVF